jgi:hypothetical protein
MPYSSRSNPKTPLPASKKRPRQQQVSDALAPTAERLRHGVVERLSRPIADEYGAPGRPFRAVDTLAAMERRGRITAGMRGAGEDFRETFQPAHLDPLRAARLERTGGCSPTALLPGHRIELARERVWQTIRMIGGVGSPAGSCLWHVVGLEQTIKAWAMLQEWRRKRLDEETAGGILIGALGMLETLQQR